MPEIAETYAVDLGDSSINELNVLAKPGLQQLEREIITSREKYPAMFPSDYSTYIMTLRRLHTDLELISERRKPRHYGAGYGQTTDPSLFVENSQFVDLLEAEDQMATKRFSEMQSRLEWKTEMEQSMLSKRWREETGNEASLDRPDWLKYLDFRAFQFR